jgi:DNA (cytosine-5)-methyltransferase 1
MNFLDLFAGAGGLSEGFLRAGFKPAAHVESDLAACFTLRTRMAYHWLKRKGRAELYANYLNGAIDRPKFYESVPKIVINSVINAEIGASSLSNIFQRVDDLLGNRSLDLIIGGPPCQT